MSKNGAIRYEFGDEIDDSHPFFTQEGEDREGNPNQYIENMTDGAIAGFKYFEFVDVLSISVKIRGSGNEKLKVRKRIGDEIVSQISIDLSEEWTSFKAPLRIENGVSAIYFTYQGEGAIDVFSFVME